VETGVLFRLRNIAVVDASTYEPFPSEILPPYVLELQPGDPAKAADLRAANARLIDYFRAQSHPLVKAPLPHATVNHALLTMDVTFSVDPGPKAGFGEVSINGPNSFDPSIVRFAQSANPVPGVAPTGQPISVSRPPDVRGRWRPRLRMTALSGQQDRAASESAQWKIRGCGRAG
jgi:hypothetical protein